MLALISTNQRAFLSSADSSLQNRYLHQHYQTKVNENVSNPPLWAKYPQKMNVGTFIHNKNAPLWKKIPISGQTLVEISASSQIARKIFRKIKNGIN